MVEWQIPDDGMGYTGATSGIISGNARLIGDPGNF